MKIKLSDGLSQRDVLERVLDEIDLDDMYEQARENDPHNEQIIGKYKLQFIKNDACHLTNRTTLAIVPTLTSPNNINEKLQKFTFVVSEDFGFHIVYDGYRQKNFRTTGRINAKGEREINTDTIKAALFKYLYNLRSTLTTKVINTEKETLKAELSEPYYKLAYRIKKHIDNNLNENDNSFIKINTLFNLSDKHVEFSIKPTFYNIKSIDTCTIDLPENARQDEFRLRLDVDNITKDGLIRLLDVLNLSHDEINVN